MALHLHLRNLWHNTCPNATTPICRPPPTPPVTTRSGGGGPASATARLRREARRPPPGLEPRRERRRWPQAEAAPAVAQSDRSQSSSHAACGQSGRAEQWEGGGGGRHVVQCPSKYSKNTFPLTAMVGVSSTIWSHLHAHVLRYRTSFLYLAILTQKSSPHLKRTQVGVRNPCPYLVLG